MQINFNSDNIFNGRIIYDKKLSTNKINYIKDILNDKLNGVDLSKRIAESTFNIYVSSSDTKKTVHPTVYFYTFFKHLKNPNVFNSIKGESCRVSKELRIDTPLSKGADHLNNFIDFVNKQKEYQGFSYNSFGEKIKAYFKWILVKNCSSYF